MTQTYTHRFPADSYDVHRTRRNSWKSIWVKIQRLVFSESAETCGAGASSSGGGDDRRTSSGGNSNDEPLVSDLRLHIAKDLQMEDSAELLELLVANKILDMNLKLRVVQQVLWKKYVEENATSASSAGVVVQVLASNDIHWQLFKYDFQ